MPCCWMGICGGSCVVLLGFLDMVPGVRLLMDWWFKNWMKRLKEKRCDHDHTETD